MLTAEQRQAMDRLNAIGYAEGVRAAPDIVSVTVNDPQRATPGYNFYTSGHATEAYLIDMDGNLVHRWSYDYDKLWPELDVPVDAAGRGKWRRAHLLPNGDILVIHEGIGMIKLDRDSNLLWEYPGLTHHAMQVVGDGTIWTLARRALMIPRIDPDLPCMDDYIVHLDADGNELLRVSVLESLEKGGCQEILDRIQYKDLFHTNSIEVLDGSLADRLPEFAAGNVLISLRHEHAIAVVDVEAAEVVWWMDGDFRWQHDAKVLPSGRIMLFDNRGGGKASAVLEIDPVTRKVLWSYRGTEKDPFYSKTCGTAYRLPNGHTLITESDAGRAFEITPEKEIVWEFYNPHRGGDDLEYIACLFDLVRVDRDEVDGWLAGVRRE